MHEQTKCPFRIVAMCNAPDSLVEVCDIISDVKKYFEDILHSFMGCTEIVHVVKDHIRLKNILKHCIRKVLLEKDEHTIKNVIEILEKLNIIIEDKDYMTKIMFTYGNIEIYKMYIIV